MMIFSLYLTFSFAFSIQCARMKRGPSRTEWLHLYTYIIIIIIIMVDVKNDLFIHDELYLFMCEHLFKKLGRKFFANQTLCRSID